MVKTGSWFVLALTIFLLRAPARADVNVSASVDRNEISVGENLNLTISVNSSESLVVGDQRLPELKGFELTNQWSGRESRSVFANGKFQFLQTQNFNYALQSTQPGTFTIPPVDVVVNNKSYKTQPITVTVLDEGARPKHQPTQQRAQNKNNNGGGSAGAGDDDGDSNDPFFKDADDLFNQLLQRHGIAGGTRGGQAAAGDPNNAFSIQLEVDKQEAFVGEQVTANWYLYTRNMVQNIDSLKYPNLQGFWKEDIEVATRLNFQNEVVNGIPYKKALLVSYALFPIKDGSSLIDSYKAKCTVVAGNGIFGMGQPVVATKSSPEIKIRVKPLPTAGRPADFTGGVGDFEVKTSMDSKNVPANQPFSYKIRFEGHGNAKTIELPPLNLPSNLELYDTKNDSKFFKDGSSYKEFELLLIPRQEGKFTVPGFSVSLFNPKKVQYQTKNIAPTEIMVGPGRAVPNQVATTVNTEGSPEAKKNLEPGLLLEWDSPSHVSSAATTAGWSGLFAFAFLILGWKAVRELGIGEKRRSLKERAAKRFKHVRVTVDKGEWRSVGAEVTNIIYFVLAELAGEKGANTEIDKLWEKLPPSIKQELGEKLRTMLRDFEILSFAPEGAVGSMKEPAELKKRVDGVETLMYRAISLSNVDEMPSKV